MIGWRRPLPTSGRRDLREPNNVGGTCVSPIANPVCRSDTLSAWLLAVVRVPDRLPKLAIKLGAVQHDLLRMHRLDGADRHGEITGVLDVDHQLRPAIRRNLPNRAELLASIGNKSLKSNFDFLLHDVFSSMLLPDELRCTFLLKGGDSFLVVRCAPRCALRLSFTFQDCEQAHRLFVDP